MARRTQPPPNPNPQPSPPIPTPFNHLASGEYPQFNWSHLVGGSMGLAFVQLKEVAKQTPSVHHTPRPPNPAHTTPPSPPPTTHPPTRQIPSPRRLQGELQLLQLLCLAAPDPQRLQHRGREAPQHPHRDQHLGSKPAKQRASERASQRVSGVVICLFCFFLLFSSSFFLFFFFFEMEPPPFGCSFRGESNKARQTRRRRRRRRRRRATCDLGLVHFVASPPLLDTQIWDNKKKPRPW